MKSERRHDLETNTLAVQLQAAIEKVKPHLGQILGLVAAIAIAAAVWTTWTNRSSAVESNAWQEYMLASYSSDRELMDMKRLAENEAYQGTAVAEWAYLAWCDRQLQLASQSYLLDRDSAISRLKSIQGIYSTLATGASEPILRNRAQYALAQVYEMQGKVEQARAAYEKVSGDLAMLAADRANQLEAEDVQSAVAWLASAELPKPNLSFSPRSESTRPMFEADVPLVSPSAEDAPINRTFEEILSGVGNDENRYNEQAETEQAEEDSAPQADESEQQEASEQSSEAPAE